MRKRIKEKQRYAETNTKRDSERTNGKVKQTKPKYNTTYKTHRNKYKKRLVRKSIKEKETTNTMIKKQNTE